VFARTVTNKNNNSTNGKRRPQGRRFAIWPTLGPTVPAS
jgi:hypothetical protein